MNEITQEMKHLIATQLCFVATINPDGTPDLGPKGTMIVFDDHHLAFGELTGHQTWTNLVNGSKAAVAVVDRQAMKGFRFDGTPELVTSGEDYDRAVAMIRLPAPRAVVKIRVDKIYPFRFPYPDQPDS